MAIREICNQEMLTADGCLEDQNRIPYGLETAWEQYNIRHLSARCEDCNVKLGSAKGLSPVSSLHLQDADYTTPYCNGNDRCALILFPLG
jgi:hypothetical protein